MLHDRHYMREPDFRSGKPLWLILIIINVACFALQMVNRAYLHLPVEYLALSPAGIGRGYVWQLLTFQFLHADFWHLFFNMLAIWMFGRTVEERLGPPAFLKLYFLSGLAGGLLQVILGFLFPSALGGPTVGASAGTFGLFAAFCLMEPHAEIRVMMVLPVRAINLLYFQLAAALFFTIVPSRSPVAHAAHLGGTLFAIAFMRWGVLSRMPSFNLFKSLHRKPRRQYANIAPAKTAKWKTTPPSPSEMPAEEFMSHEVDPILDKISAQGIHSLTDRERQILEAARKKMSKK